MTTKLSSAFLSNYENNDKDKDPRLYFWFLLSRHNAKLMAEKTLNEAPHGLIQSLSISCASSNHVRRIIACSAAGTRTDSSSFPLHGTCHLES